MMYTLYRIEDDSSTTFISEYPDLVAGIAAGKHMVEVEDYDYPYCLNSNGTRLATFGEGRIGYREWAMRRGYIHSLDDRYDHDVDELMA